MKPVVLCILDGWGHRPVGDGDSALNAIARAHTPHWDRLTASNPHSVIDASELHVGLPDGQMGNSEVGHMNIGSGRVVLQDLPRIDQAIRDGSLAADRILRTFIDTLKASGGACHLLGLLSPGGVHAHQGHIAALAKIVADEGVPVHVHAFLDGRDTPPQSAIPYLETFEAAIEGSRGIGIATVSGRYYAMDRDTRWDRVQKAYDVLVDAKGASAASAEDAVRRAYAADQTDEFVLPTVVTCSGYQGMRDGDGVLMANFRADRARQLLTALLDPAFSGFFRSRTVRFGAALGLVEYSQSHNAWMATLFAPEQLECILGEVVANAGRTQLRIAETEKYAHVTFFFNGGREEPFTGEERILVPSPNVATYDLKPEMSAFEVTEKLEAAIASGRFDLIVVNYANADMVGHTGDLGAAIKAVETVDTCLGRLDAAVRATGGVLMITADHGNIETMHDEHSNQPHTAHTLNQVPFVLIGAGQVPLRDGGRLADIAPTILAFLDLAQPAQMTGSPLARPARQAA